MVVVRPGDPKAWWSKALDVLRVVDKDLGFAEGVHCDPNHSMASSFFFSYIIPWLSLFFFSGTFIFCLEILFFLSILLLQVYLYISDKTVVGCLLAVPVKSANRMVETSAEAEGIDCCTAEEYPVKCGVSRIWVHRPNRRANVARQLMDCMR